MKDKIVLCKTSAEGWVITYAAQGGKHYVIPFSFAQTRREAIANHTQYSKDWARKQEICGARAVKVKLALREGD